MQAIRLDEFLNYHFLSNVKLSPSADKAAFVVSKSNEEKDGYTSGIWTVDLNTKECRMLTAGKDESSFLWLKDDTLLFTSRRDRTKPEEVDQYYTDCFVISLHGGEARKRMTIDAPARVVASIDADTYLLDVSYDNNVPENFFTMNVKNCLLPARKKRIMRYFPSFHSGEMVQELPTSNAAACTCTMQ